MSMRSVVSRPHELPARIRNEDHADSHDEHEEDRREYGSESHDDVADGSHDEPPSVRTCIARTVIASAVVGEHASRAACPIAIALLARRRQVAPIAWRSSRARNPSCAVATITGGVHAVLKTRHRVLPALRVALAERRACIGHGDRCRRARLLRHRLRRRRERRRLARRRWRCSASVVSAGHEDLPAASHEGDGQHETCAHMTLRNAPRRANGPEPTIPSRNLSRSWRAPRHDEGRSGAHLL